MAASAQCFDIDFSFENDFDPIANIIDEDYLEKNEDLNSHVSDVIKEINETPKTASFTCDICSKICKSSKGLKIHGNIKHGVTATSTIEFTKPKLSLDEFKNFVMHYSKKLAFDECYSEETMTVFKNFQISSEETKVAFSYVEDVIRNFNGNAEKFMPEFYNCLSRR